MIAPELQKSSELSKRRNVTSTISTHIVPIDEDTIGVSDQDETLYPVFTCICQTHMVEIHWRISPQRWICSAEICRTYQGLGTSRTLCYGLWDAQFEYGVDLSV